MSEISVVLMQNEQLPLIGKIAASCFSSPWSEENMRSELENPHAIPLAAFQKGKAVGFVFGNVICDEGTIGLLGVDPKCRRSGVASALLAEFLRRAKENGAKNVYLEVRASNEAAIALYRKSGFLKAGVRKEFYRNPGEDAVLMTARLEKDIKEGNME